MCGFDDCIWYCLLYSGLSFYVGLSVPPARPTLIYISLQCDILNIVDTHIIKYHSIVIYSTAL